MNHEREICMVCSNCKNKINDGINFCPFCGYPQNKNTVEGKTALKADWINQKDKKLARKLY